MKKLEIKHIEKNVFKTIATKFFFWWYNRGGTNTEEAFDKWYEENKELIEKESSVLKEACINEHLKGIE